MSTWLEDHLDEVIDRFAAEDGTTNEGWRGRAVESVARRRMTGEMNQQGFVYCDDWLAGRVEVSQTHQEGDTK